MGEIGVPQQIIPLAKTAEQEAIEKKEALFESWLLVGRSLVTFEPKNMPTRAYDDVAFYKIQKSLGLDNESPEIQETAEKFKQKTAGQNLFDFWEYYERRRREIENQQ